MTLNRIASLALSAAILSSPTWVLAHKVWQEVNECMTRITYQDDFTHEQKKMLEKIFSCTPGVYIKKLSNTELLVTIPWEAKTVYLLPEMVKKWIPSLVFVRHLDARN
jgi:hypothetical protein